MISRRSAWVEGDEQPLDSSHIKTCRTIRREQIGVLQRGHIKRNEQLKVRRIKGGKATWRDFSRLPSKERVYVRDINGGSNAALRIWEADRDEDDIDDDIEDTEKLLIAERGSGEVATWKMEMARTREGLQEDADVGFVENVPHIHTDSPWKLQNDMSFVAIHSPALH
jgi:hypothetical protein